jgi:hypothetical protein
MRTSCARFDREDTKLRLIRRVLLPTLRPMQTGILAFLADVTGDADTRAKFDADPTGVMDSYNLSESAQATILAAGKAGEPDPSLLQPIGQLVVDELTETFQATW